MKDLKKFIREYEGSHPYLLTLKEVVEAGEELNFTQKMFAEKLLIATAVKKQDRNLLPLPKIKSFDVDWEKYNLKPPYNFQKLGSNWLMNKKRAILADEMGTGKTYQSIIAALELNLERILIICPNTLKLNWKEEIESVDPGAKVSVYDKTLEQDAKWTIVNYDRIFKIEKELKKLKVELLIGDEAHYVKSGRKAKRAATFQRIATSIPRVWLLTGTPIANRPIDFYQLLKICKHDLGKNKEVYGKKYCGAKRNNWGWSYDGASNLKDLHFRIQDVLLRRTKKDVLDLPDKQLIPVYLQLKNIKDYYRSAELKFQEIYDGIDDPDSEHYEKDLGSGAAFIEMAAYRMFTALEKVKDGTLKEMINNVLDAGDKVVVFTNFTSVIDAIKEEFKENCVALDGRVSMSQRQENIRSFQQGKPQICACNYKVGSVGVTLTRATYAIMNDYPWDPATLKQAEDRIHRIGQEKKTVIYFPIYKNTIDQAIFDVLRNKTKDIHEAIDGDANLVKFKYKGSVADPSYSLINFFKSFI